MSTHDAADGELWVIRHGETEWSRDGLHTSHTELELTAEGEEVARKLAERLEGVEFDLVLSSPRVRARRTAELAGFTDIQLEDDLTEWDYGDYEGRTTPEIREEVPGWTVWTHPSPGGERPNRSPGGSTASSPRCARTADACWCSATATHRAPWRHAGSASRCEEGRLFKLDTATISVLGYERESPVVARWNS